jgi:hypothetical protein
MNWDAIGAVGEIVGASAVVATIVYLAFQIRDSKVATRALTYQSIYRDFRDNLLSMPESSRNKILSGESLSEEDHRALFTWRVVMFRGYENIWMQKELGTLDERMFKSYISHMKNTLRQPGTIGWWRLATFEFIPEFSSYVDSLIGELKETKVSDQE